MKYDPIKDSLGSVIRSSVLLRRLFYTALGIMFLREWHVKRELRRQLGKTTEPLEIYDAGTGFGQYSYYMARKFPNVFIYAVDVKADQIADCRRFFAARNLSGCEFAVEDLTKVAHEAKFDFVLSVDVMEHIADDVTVFRNFFKGLKRGGHLFINTPSDLGGSDAHSSNDPSFIEEHARNGYNIAEIKKKLESVGFRVESIRFTYGPYGSLAWRIGIKWPIMMVNASRLFFVILPFYYALTLWLVLPLMALDFFWENPYGTGLNVVAVKP